MSKLRLSIVVLVTLFLSGVTLAQPITDTEILWDNWGVPHIYAPDNENLFYAFGWAQAHNHGDLILRLYGESRGRAAEYWGGERYLQQDILFQTLDIPGQGQATYDAQTDEWQSYIDAFAAGINDYVATHPDEIDDAVEVVVPVTGPDVMAHGLRVLRYEFLARAGLRIARGLGNLPATDMGSNGWAVGPSKSASGSAMLVANPHQPWSTFGLWIEAEFNTPDLHMYGAALVGNPVLGIAFNDYLGWTHTVNTHDGWDLYALTLSDDGDSYLYDGDYVRFASYEVGLRENLGDGSFRQHTITVQRSVHGPVISYGDDGTALALRVVGDDHYGATRQWFDMGLATNLEEFEAVLSRLQIPMFTVIYADRDGNIMHLFNELVPVRDAGDWAFWNNTTDLDSSNPAIIPGDDSRYLWTEYHPYEDLPRVLNPESAWVQNANEPPWTATYPLALDPADFPAYIAPAPYVLPRSQSSIRLLMGDDSITFDELVAYKHDTFVETTIPLLDDLIAAARESDVEIVGRAAEVLEGWDRHADADSVGAALFALWLATYVDTVGVDGVFAVPWDINDPIYTPDGLADPESAVEVLETVAKQLELTRLIGGGLDVPYGDVFRLRVGDYDLPANGGNDLMGTFRIITPQQDTDLRFRTVHGDSYIAIVEFGETVHAKVLLSYGNATQPDSPHVGDQLTLFAAKELRDALLTREDVEANLDVQETFLPR